MVVREGGREEGEEGEDEGGVEIDVFMFSCLFFLFFLCIITKKEQKIGDSRECRDGESRSLENRDRSGNM